MVDVVIRRRPSGAGVKVTVSRPRDGSGIFDLTSNPIVISPGGRLSSSSCFRPERIGGYRTRYWRHSDNRDKRLHPFIERPHAFLERVHPDGRAICPTRAW
jgi:hypothetical protein